jgi:hypothetical protein
MSAAIVAFTVVAFVGVISVVFWFLQQLSNEAYRPTAGEMAGKLRCLTAGELTWAALDELSCVRIAYDGRLDQIRERFNVVLDDLSSYDNSSEKSPTVKLSDTGRARISELINELEALAT